MKAALKEALQQISQNTWKIFDSKNEKYIDAINVMYAGKAIWEDGSLLWPHNATVDIKFNVPVCGEFKTNFYMLTNLGVSASELKIGTFCHESGHLLCRFPDLYDYGCRDGDSTESAGAGDFCLMSSGNHLDNDGSPAPICGYLRYLAKWCDDVQDLSVPGSYILTLSPSVIGIYRVSEFEFFILENYMRCKFTASLPDDGLAIWHCDTQGSNEWQMGTKEKHYQCALVQADGKEDLEHDRNKGDQGDLYHPQQPGVFFSNQTSPSSKAWDRRDSGLMIRDLQVGTSNSLAFSIVKPKLMPQNIDAARYQSAVVGSPVSSHYAQEENHGVVLHKVPVYSSLQQDFRQPLILNARQSHVSRPPIPATSIAPGVTQTSQEEDQNNDHGCPIC